MSWDDPIVADVRRIREELSAEFDYDVAAIFADLRNRQCTVGDRLIRLSRARNARKAEQGDAPERPNSPVRNG